MKENIVIIGAGIIGCSIARELSKYDIDITILEKSVDVSNGASKANSGIIHGGYDAPHNKLKGYFSRKGNQMFDQLENELNFGFERIGSLVLAFNKEELTSLEKLYQNGKENGVDSMDIISRDTVIEMEPNVNKNVIGALYCSDAGIASPYEYCIALAENAIMNGVKLELNQEVTNINNLKDSRFEVFTNKRIFEASIVINCAGVFADKIDKMIGLEDYVIEPRKGEYLVFARGYGNVVNHVLFQAPSKLGKGILVTPTYHGNLMIGPDAQERVGRNDVDTDLSSLKVIVDKAKKSVPDFDIKKIIRSFSGLRASSNKKDFFVGKTDIYNFYRAGGIESPGLTSSPAIAKHMINSIIKHSKLKLKKKTNFNPIRPRIIKKKFSTDMLPFGKVKELINLENNDNRKLICRCEQVNIETIKDCLNRGIKVTTLDGVKRRTRAGMGACQGQFCGPRVTKVIANFYGIDEQDVTQRGKVSGRLPDRIQSKDLRKYL